MCSVVSVTMKSEYELVSDAVLGTDLHLSEEYISSTHIRRLFVDVDLVSTQKQPGCKKRCGPV